MLLREWKEPIVGDFVLDPTGPHDDWSRPPPPEKMYRTHRYELFHFEEAGVYKFSEVHYTINGEFAKGFRGQWDRKKRDFKGVASSIDPREIEERR